MKYPTYGEIDIANIDMVEDWLFYLEPKTKLDRRKETYLIKRECELNAKGEYGSRSISTRNLMSRFD